MVETALSREKKNEEISDGDKESALVNIVVTHMFCGDPVGKYIGLLQFKKKKNM